MIVHQLSFCLLVAAFDRLRWCIRKRMHFFRRSLARKSRLSLYLLFASCVLPISFLQVMRHQSLAQSHLESQNILVNPDTEAGRKFRGALNLQTFTRKTTLPDASLSAFSSDINTTQLVNRPKRTIETSESDGAVVLPESELTESVKILLKEATRNRPIFDEEIDPAKEEARCARYGFRYDGRKTRRRIFFGTLIADDSWHSIGATAIEMHGMLHTAAFVESNRTQMFIERELRFGPASKELRVLKQMFGPWTNVTMDYFVDEPPADIKDQWKRDGLIRENLQREIILQSWQRAGMTGEDIGLISDVDEVFTRDFLRAAQICDVPEFQPGQDCRAPKIFGSTLQFQSSPECVVWGNRWYHPDIIRGECIHFIGDSEHHKPPLRVYKNVSGWRQEGYGEAGQYNEMPNTTMYPLWNAADFRMTQGGRAVNGVNGEHTGYHFHNFFVSTKALRFKYLSYAHPVWNAFELPLGEIHQILDFVVDCVMDRSEEGNKRKRLPGGLGKIAGPLPLAFQIDAYSRERHAELKEMVMNDERSYQLKTRTNDTVQKQL